MNPHFATTTRQSFAHPPAGTPLTREELVIAARLADHLASQLAELDRRELLLKADMSQLLVRERALEDRQEEIRGQVRQLALSQSELEDRGELERLLHAREQDVLESRRLLESQAQEFAQEKARWQAHHERLLSEHAAELNEKIARAVEDAVRRESDERLAEVTRLRETCAAELEAARLKIVEERVAFEGDLARVRRRADDELAQREAELDKEALRLRSLRQKSDELKAALEVQLQELRENKQSWQREADQRTAALEANLQKRVETAEAEILRMRQEYAVDTYEAQRQELEAERSKVAEERKSAIEEIERRKRAAQDLLGGQRDSLEQLRIELDREQQKLAAARAEHEQNVQEWVNASRSQAQKLVTGLDDIRREKLAGLDLREAELTRREVDFKKRTQLHEQHLDRVRAELKTQRAENERQRQRQRVWMEEVETSIRLRMSHLRRFRDLIAAREQGLDAERQHLLEMQQSSTANEARQLATLEQLRSDFLVHGTQLRDWLAHPRDGLQTPEAVSAALSILLQMFEQRGQELQELLSTLQGQRDRWQSERLEAEQVIRQLVQQLELALDELAEQQPSMTPVRVPAEHAA